MIQLYRMKREDTGSEYNLRCDDALLASRKVGKGPPKIGDQFAAISKLDGSTYLETLIHIGKRGTANATGVFVLKSDAMGINPTQRAEAMANDKAMGIFAEYDEQGRAVFRSKKQYRKYAETHGFKDHNGGYESPRSLNDNERQNLGLPMLAHHDDGSFVEYD